MQVAARERAESEARAEARVRALEGQLGDATARAAAAEDSLRDAQQRECSVKELNCQLPDFKACRDHLRWGRLGTWGLLHCAAKRVGFKPNASQHNMSKSPWVPKLPITVCITTLVWSCPCSTARTMCTTGLEEAGAGADAARQQGAALASELEAAKLRAESLCSERDGLVTQLQQVQAAMVTLQAHAGRCGRSSQLDRVR